MKVKELRTVAVIPTAQYANLQAEIVVEVDNDIEAAKQRSLEYVTGISQAYAEPGKAIPVKQGDSVGLLSQPINSVPPVELTSDLTGGKAFFDEVDHVYTNQFGQKLMSGSEFAEKFCPEFNPGVILPKMEAKYGVSAEVISDMWKAKADASCYIGDAIHKALELYGKYHADGEKIDEDKKPEERKWYHLHDNPILRPAVTAFYRTRKDETAVYEAFIVNGDAMLCGHIDRLLITGEKRCRVQDFKTNGSIDKKGSPKFLSAPFGDIENTTLNKYWLQLSFYAHILTLAGWTVEGLDIFHYTLNDDGDMEWQTHSHAVIDITGADVLQQIKQQ